MIYSINILAEASTDIKEVTSWYKDISQSLAVRFVSELYDGFTKIVATPNAWFNLTKRIRRYVLPHFPYMILFLCRR